MRFLLKLCLSHLDFSLKHLDVKSFLINAPNQMVLDCLKKKLCEIYCSEVEEILFVCYGYNFGLQWESLFSN